MWKCAGCKESIDEEFDACWQCGRDRRNPGETSSDASAAETLMPNGQARSQFLSEVRSQSQNEDVVQALTKRYKDAYRSARWLIQLGGLIKFVSIGLFVIVICFSMIASNVLPVAFPIVVMLGIAGCIPIYIMGVLTAGQGQTNLATLDTAVNTSRHLSKDHVAKLLFEQ